MSSFSLLISIFQTDPLFLERCDRYINIIAGCWKPLRSKINQSDYPNSVELV